jgi:catechol 2,3-dioxygenase-like lactoylglutathione lyase family enzyme
MNGIIDILYVRFSVKDLKKQQKFLEDFGFTTSLKNDTLIGSGTSPYPYHYIATAGDDAFLGFGVLAESRADLDRIAAIDGVTAEPITDLPGGGFRARMIDPNGFEVDIVSNLETLTETPLPARSPINNQLTIDRLGERAVLPTETNIVNRLGHCVINVRDFRESETWYKKRLGFITSDEIYIGEEANALGAFMRVNRGAEYVDHHTLFCVGTGEPGFNHAAFEVHDWDTLMLGHDRLKAAAYQHRWGVGKHVLGSQVFDYWQDPHGFTLEHFTDGDLINEAFGSHKQPIDQLLGVHWGPEGSP